MGCVHDEWGMRCPKCKKDNRLGIQITTWALLTGNGSEEYGDHEWYGDSPVICQSCGWQGTVAETEGKPAPVKSEPAPATKPPARIVVTISGGVAEVADSENWPEGLEVFVIDYDNDGERVDGEECSLGKIEKGDADRDHTGYLVSAAVKSWTNCG